MPSIADALKNPQSLRRPGLARAALAAFARWGRNKTRKMERQKKGGTGNDLIDADLDYSGSVHKFRPRYNPYDPAIKEPPALSQAMHDGLNEGIRNTLGVGAAGVGGGVLGSIIQGLYNSRQEAEADYERAVAEGFEGSYDDYQVFLAKQVFEDIYKGRKY